MSFGVGILEILKRAKGDSGDTVSFRHNEKDIQEEVNRRSYKAGYTDRDGQPRVSRNTGAGKGDVPRPCNMKKYRENYVKIFRHN